MSGSICHPLHHSASSVRTQVSSPLLRPLLLYFAVYNAHPCFCTHYTWDHPWYVIIILIYNAHPYFSLKNLGKTAHYTWQNMVLSFQSVLGQRQGTETDPEGAIRSDMWHQNAQPIPPNICQHSRLACARGVGVTGSVHSLGSSSTNSGMLSVTYFSPVYQTSCTVLMFAGPS